MCARHIPLSCFPHPSSLISRAAGGPPGEGGLAIASFVAAADKFLARAYIKEPQVYGGRRDLRCGDGGAGCRRHGHYRVFTWPAAHLHSHAVHRAL